MTSGSAWEHRPRARCHCGVSIDPAFTLCPDCSVDAVPLFDRVPDTAVAAHPSSSWQARSDPASPDGVVA